jgi:hypothetical protein
VIDSRVELRRLVGKAALLLAGIYILVLFAAVVAAMSGNQISAWGWPLLTLPGFAFVPAVTDALLRANGWGESEADSGMAWWSGVHGRGGLRR